jgi:Xaa-Pro aminopeptidase
MPGLGATIDIETGKATLYGDNASPSLLIWTGPQTPLPELAEKVGIHHIAPRASFDEQVEKAYRGRRIKVHHTQQYRNDNPIAQHYMGNTVNDKPLVGDALMEYVNSKASEPLTRAIVAQREIKTREEIQQILQAHAILKQNLHWLDNWMQQGDNPLQMAGLLKGLTEFGGCSLTFKTIVTTHGEVLHNPTYPTELETGKPLLVDYGVETQMGYGADITRMFPTNKERKWDSTQQQIYDVLLRAQKSAIKLIRPGVRYKDIHLDTAKDIAVGLRDMDLLRGTIDDIVENGAHALFFPHGLGHQLGLNAHDMEALGENFVGYTQRLKRNPQFGLRSLRMAKELKPGMVVTVEPGIYFIPGLMDQWKNDGTNKEFINWNVVDKFRDMRGFRLEDDVLVTEDDNVIIGELIPK